VLRRQSAATLKQRFNAVMPKNYEEKKLKKMSRKKKFIICFVLRVIK